MINTHPVASVYYIASPHSEYMYSILVFGFSFQSSVLHLIDTQLSRAELLAWSHSDCNSLCSTKHNCLDLVYPFGAFPRRQRRLWLHSMGSPVGRSYCLPLLLACSTYATIYAPHVAPEFLPISLLAWGRGRRIEA